MRALNDYPIELPYRAVVPWPVVYTQTLQQDWMDTVYRVEQWLECQVGPHYQRWVWSMWSLHQTDLCSVSFLRDPDRILFLIRWGGQ